MQGSHKRDQIDRYGLLFSILLGKESAADDCGKKG